MRILATTTDPDALPDAAEYALESFSDGDLLDAWAQDQHAKALATLVHRYSVMVLSVCRRRCRSDADAEDAFQTTFLYLARNGHKIRKPERLPGWLHRVAQRSAMATWKSSKRETEPMVEPPADPDDPFDQLTQRHEAIVLDEELADLPEHYRSALVMHIYDGHPLQHLADHFGTTIGSVRGRLQRGKQMLARRLRHRGVVPVLAFASAQGWTADAALASDASETLIHSIGEGPLPSPPPLPPSPIEPALLESLLTQGARLMPSIYVASGLLAGTALLALAVNGHGESPRPGSSGQPQTLTLPPAVVGQFGGPVASNQLGATPNSQTAQPSGGGNPPSAQGGGSEQNGARPWQPMGQAGGLGGGGFGGGGFGGFPGAGNQPPTVWASRPVIPQPSTAVAKAASAALDKPVDLSVRGSLADLPQMLTEIADVPVLIDHRAINFAKLKVDDLNVRLDAEGMPLRSALRTMLRPHGLKAVIEDEGLVITADPVSLVQQGIGTNRWINVDEKAAEMIGAKLQEPTTVTMVELPLAEVVRTIGDMVELPIAVDRRALEDIGLADDSPITFEAEGMKLHNALKMMLADLDLTYTIRGESLVVTTAEAADSELLHRVYWLESTGIAANDYDTLTSLITSSISPDVWADMGGNSTIAPMGSQRPALLISTSYTVHENIENLMKTLRETHFGSEPVLEQVQVPASEAQQGGMGGGLGGGGFF